MNVSYPNLLITASIDYEQRAWKPSIVKMLISSVSRSLFSGDIAVFRGREMPLFKVNRSALTEMRLPFAKKEGSNTLAHNCLCQLYESVSPQPRQWVIVTHDQCLALRNIDHLISPDVATSFYPPEIDFYWARAGKDELSNYSASPGIWAVRGEYFQLVMNRLNEAWGVSAAINSGEEAIWTRVVQELPLRKRPFEKGEVVAPRIGAVDWEAVSNAAFVTVPDWPEKEAWKFLQALYLGTYLGDETGMMLNILEA